MSLEKGVICHLKRNISKCYVQSLLLLLQENVCNVSLITMELVDDCPRNNNTLQIRLKSKRCSDFPLCKSEPLVYHCVPYEGSVVEVCAPEGHIIGNTRMDYCGQVFCRIYKCHFFLCIKVQISINKQ